MQTVGAQWLLIDTSPLLVSLVQAASSLPIVVLALPAGAWADMVDRRHPLLGAQLAMFLAAAALATATFLGSVSPALILVLTFALGCCNAAAGPSWQAIQPDLVDRGLLPQAAALNGLNMNVARAVGPAVGGLIVATAGAGWVFALDAASLSASRPCWPPGDLPSAPKECRLNGWSRQGVPGPVAGGGEQGVDGAGGVAGVLQWPARDLLAEDEAGETVGLQLVLIQRWEFVGAGGIRAGAGGVADLDPAAGGPAMREGKRQPDPAVGSECGELLIGAPSGGAVLDADGDGCVPAAVVEQGAGKAVDAELGMCFEGGDDPDRGPW